MKHHRVFLFAVVPLVALFLLPSGQSWASPKARFLVIAPHTKEECLKTLDEVKAMPKMLEKCDWGCMSGDHTCYVVLEGKDEADVKKMLPANWSTATIHPVTKFTAKEIESFHKK
jgi:hypothetical protein